MISLGLPQRFNTEFSSRDFTARFATLTPAEREVAQYLSRGLLNKEIATLLGKSEPTVKNQISSILGKTGAYSRCRFIAQYYQQFICPLPVEASTIRSPQRTLFFAAPTRGANCS